MKKLCLIFLLVCFLAVSAWAMNPTFLQLVSGGGTCAESDQFTGANDSAPNATKWTESDVGNYMDIQTNKLNFSCDDTTIHTSNIISNFHFTGDFDIQVEFDVTTLEQPDAGNQHCPRFKIKNSDDSVYAEIIRIHTTGGNNQYAINGSSTVYADEDPAAEDAAKMRLVRVGNDVTGYIWDPDDGGGARWEWNNNANGITFDETFNMAVYVVIGWNAPETTVAAENTGNIDNFTINSGSCYY